MDLLYKKERYQEVLEVFDLLLKQQFQGAKFPRNPVVLAFAACYKLVGFSLQKWYKCVDIVAQLDLVVQCMCFCGSHRTVQTA